MIRYHFLHASSIFGAHHMCFLQCKTINTLYTYALPHWTLLSVFTYKIICKTLLMICNIFPKLMCINQSQNVSVWQSHSHSHLCQRCQYLVTPVEGETNQVLDAHHSSPVDCSQAQEVSKCGQLKALSDVILAGWWLYIKVFSRSGPGFQAVKGLSALIQDCSYSIEL